MLLFVLIVISGGSVLQSVAKGWNRRIGCLLNLKGIDDAQTKTFYNYDMDNVKVGMGERIGMARKIIFVTEHPYTVRDHHRFGADYLQSKGYDVETWRVLTGRSVLGFRATESYSGAEYHEYEFEEFKRRLKDNLKAVYILFKSNDVGLEIIKQGCFYMLFLGLGGVYIIDNKPNNKPDNEYVTFGSLLRRKWETLLRIGIFGSFNLIYGRIKNRVLWARLQNAENKNPPKLILTSTVDVAKVYVESHLLKQNVLYTHVWDYDRYIELERGNAEEIPPCIVFCDSGFIGEHYDLKLLGVEIMSNRQRDKYRRQVNELLEKFEKEYKVESFFLGHPNVKYPSDEFFGKKIIINRTCEFIKSAKLVIMDCSNSINFALLYDVPILKVVNRDFETIPHSVPAPNFYEFIKWEASERYGCGFLDMDDEEAMKNPSNYVKKTDRRIRDTFLRKYVTGSEPKSRLCIECVDDFLQKSSDNLRME